MIDQNWSSCPRYDADFMSQVKLEGNLADPVCNMHGRPVVYESLLPSWLTSFSRAQLAQSCLEVSMIFPRSRLLITMSFLERRWGLGDRDHSCEINSRRHGTAHVSRAKEGGGSGSACELKEASPWWWRWCLSCLWAWFEVLFSPSVIPWCKGKAAAAGMRGPCFSPHYRLFIGSLTA
jgi:hypothetical protein